MPQVLRDGVGRHPHGLGGKMGVPRRGLDLRVAEELADHRQALTRRHGSGGKGVAQVVDADVLDPRTGTDALPEGLQITQRLAGQGAGDHPRVAVNALGAPQQVRHWLANVWSEFDRIKLTDLVGAPGGGKSARSGGEK